DVCLPDRFLTEREAGDPGAGRLASDAPGAVGEGQLQPGFRPRATPGGLRAVEEGHPRRQAAAASAAGSSETLTRGAGSRFLRSPDAKQNEPGRAGPEDFLPGPAGRLRLPGGLLGWFVAHDDRRGGGVGCVLAVDGIVDFLTMHGDR